MTKLNDEYNPLDYENLTRHLVAELMERDPQPLGELKRFEKAGVYALFYAGQFPPYLPFRSPDSKLPLYVGKAVPDGARKGKRTEGPTRPLYDRLVEHRKSIEAAGNLDVADFMCRYLVVTPLWVTMAERFLIEHYSPAWNVCIEGFGNHDPGSGRHKGMISPWDTLHPGRAWATKLRQDRSLAEVERHLMEFGAKKRGS